MYVHGTRRQQLQTLPVNIDWSKSQVCSMSCSHTDAVQISRALTSCWMFAVCQVSHGAAWRYLLTRTGAGRSQLLPPSLCTGHPTSKKHDYRNKAHLMKPAVTSVYPDFQEPKHHRSHQPIRLDSQIMQWLPCAMRPFSCQDDHIIICCCLALVPAAVELEDMYCTAEIRASPTKQGWH